VALDRYDYHYASVSGLRAEALSMLGHRWNGEEMFSPRRAESWVVSVAPDVRAGHIRPRLERGRAAWFTRLWRAPSGRLYVTDSSGVLHVREPDPVAADVPASAHWTEHPLPAALMGVWGVDDSCLFVWGGTRSRDRLFHWNGVEWRELPSPGGIIAMHGLGPQHVYAVGRRGLLALWNGHRWFHVGTATRETLASVWVADAESAFACGMDGSVLEGSAWGWQTVARLDRPLFGIARWGERLWLAGGTHGLLARSGRGDRFVAVRDDIVATSIDARDHLLIGGGSEVRESNDGESFRAIAGHALARARSGQPTLWGSP
jgi:hypothetical protein